MESITEDELMRLLRSKYPDAKPFLVRNPRTEHLGGTIVSDGFAGMEGPHRQQAVWSMIRETFGPKSTTLGVLSLQTKEERNRRLHKLSVV